MRLRLAMSTLATLLTLATLQLAGPAHAQPSEEARAHVRKGDTLFGDSKYAEALAEYKQARASGASFEVLYNLGRIYQKLNDPTNALATYELYVKEGGAQIPGPRRNLVDREISKLRASLTTLDITSDPPGARVKVDGAELENPTPTSTNVLAGKHEISFTRDGNPPVVKTIEVIAGKSASVGATLPAKPVAPAASASAKPVATTAPSVTPTPVASVAARPKPVESSAAKGPTAPPWEPRPAPQLSGGVVTLWVATGLLAAGTITTGAISLHAREERDTLRNTHGASQSDIDKQHERAQTFGIVTGALGAATMLTGGLSLYFTAQIYRESIPNYPPSIPPSAPTSALLVTPPSVGWVQSF
ncbi:MAG: PEGA domain-containing protein [Polyangiaceae bacterium]